MAPMYNSDCRVSWGCGQTIKWDMNEALSDATVLSYGDVFWVGVPLPENNDNSAGWSGDG